MWYLPLSGIVGLFFAILILFFPSFLNRVSKVIDREMQVAFESSSASRMVNGLILLLAALFLILTGNWYPQLWPLFYIGIVALVFGMLFIFFPRTLNFLNELGNYMIAPPEESGSFQRVVAGLLLMLMSAYILYVYFSR